MQVKNWAAASRCMVHFSTKRLVGHVWILRPLLQFPWAPRNPGVPAEIARRVLGPSASRAQYILGSPLQSFTVAEEKYGLWVLVDSRLADACYHEHQIWGVRFNGTHRSRRSPPCSISILVLVIWLGCPNRPTKANRKIRGSFSLGLLPAVLRLVVTYGHSPTEGKTVETSAFSFSRIPNTHSIRWVDVPATNIWKF